MRQNSDQTSSDGRPSGYCANPDQSRKLSKPDVCFPPKADIRYVAGSGHCGPLRDAVLATASRSAKLTSRAMRNLHRARYLESSRRTLGGHPPQRHRYATSGLSDLELKLPANVRGLRRGILCGSDVQAARSSSMKT